VGYGFSNDNFVLLCPDYPILWAFCHICRFCSWKGILFIRFVKILFSVEPLDFWNFYVGTSRMKETLILDLTM